MELTGREGIVETALAALAASGDARSVVLEGEAGIGKSSVWAAVAEGCEAAGWRILRTRPSEPDASLAFIGLFDLLDPVADRVLDAMPRPLAGALAVALHRVEPGPEPMESGTVAVAVLAALRVLADEGPTLLAIDDAQWLDPSSATVLGSALRRLRGAPVAVLAARRSGFPSEQGLDPAGLLERVERIVLPPLSMGALHHAIRTRLGTTLSRPTLVRLHEVTAGNPYFALELASAIVAGSVGTSLHDRELPENLAALLGRRFEPLTPEVRRYATVAALAARPTRPLLLRALGLDEPTSTARLEALRDAGILAERPGGALAFGHPMLARVAASLAGESERRAIHRDLAEASEDDEARAHHLAASRSEPDEAVAATLEALAEAAAARGATIRATELLERAVALTPPAGHADRARRLTRVADALLLSGDVPRSRPLLEGVLATDPPVDVRLDATLLLATLTWFDGDSRDATDLAERALASTDNPDWRGKFHSRLSWMYEHDIAKATEHARAAMELIDPDAAPARYAFALMNAAMGELYLGISAHHDWMDRGEELQKLGSGLEFSTLPANWAKIFDRFDRARELAFEYRSAAEDTGDDGSVPPWPTFLAEIEAWSGNLRLAMELTTEGLSLAEQTQQPAFVSATRARRAWIRAVAGDLEGARDDAAAALEIGEAAHSAPLIALSLGALGFAALSEDDAAAADAAYTRADAVLREAGDVTQPAHRFQADHIEALVKLGQFDRAEALTLAHEARGRLGPRPWAVSTSLRCRALLAGARGDAEAGLAAAEAALAAMADLPLPFERARTLLVRGQLQRRLRQRRAAASSFEAAAGIFGTIGATRWAERSAAEAERLGLLRNEDDSLTPSEGRIARLAASGMTNREVAAKLFISPKTVEANLARIYGKLGIRSRAELGAAVAKLADD
jgi:DNA-binding CsgD family transcriptional regulator